MPQLTRHVVTFCTRGACIAATLSLLSILVLPNRANAQATLQPPEWNRELKLAEAADANPDPHVVEIDLEAKLGQIEIEAGQPLEVWTYNGGIPGPLIRTRLGDRLIVHFTNHLPQPTTVHWHGVRVPIDMDGVPGISQPEVEPGGTFTYDFVVRDAGLFWYHPHVLSAMQVGFGLYGALLVEDPAESATVGVADELVLVLSDLAVDNGHLEDPQSGGTTGMAFGREGTHVLVNGRQQAALTARSGAPQRWRIVNTSKSRFFDLALDDHRLQKIGGDGGLQEYPQDFDELVIAPGERADVIVTPRGQPEKPLLLRSYTFNRGYGSIELRPAEELLFTVRFADLPPYTGPAPPRTHRSMQPLTASKATPLTLNLTIAQLSDGSFQYGINKIPFWDAKPFSAQLGETQIWTLVNETVWSHPFHLHGFFFQVLDDRGAPVRPLEWKDTVNVPFKQTVRLLVRFDDDRPGNWMVHCHILDHAEGGLMGTVQVGPPAPGQSAVPHSHHHPSER